jgi:endonuclease/exonuclease/phosphatase family metal-dependent hydrolase
MHPHRRLTTTLATTVSALAAALMATLAVGGTQAAYAASPPPASVRMATYNIHAGAGQDNVYDLERTAAAISSLRADVVGLQEVDVHWGARSQWQDTATELANRLDMYVAFAPIYSLDPVKDGDPRREYGVAVLSKFPLLSVENHDITRLSTQDPNPVPAPAPGFLEAVIRAKGVPTHVYVTHLDYRGDPTVRAMQVEDTRRIMAQDPPGEPQVLLGDFNADPSAPELAPLWTWLDDAWGVAQVRRGEPGLTYPATTPVKRIDVIAPSAGITVPLAEVPDTNLATTASDHRPVVATLLLPRPTRS